MNRLIVIALLLIVVLPFSIQTQAQDKVTCDLAPVIKAANSFKTSGDVKKDLPTMLKLAEDIHAANIACNGLTFTGKGNKVIGPFILPKALYKITAVTKGYLILGWQSMTGSDCEPSKDGTIFSIGRGEGDTGAESTFDVQANCRLLLKTSNASADWKITFEPIE